MKFGVSFSVLLWWLVVVWGIVCGIGLCLFFVLYGLCGFYFVIGYGGFMLIGSVWGC